MGYELDKFSVEIAVKEIIRDLENRAGLGDAWDSLEVDVQDRIEEAWRQIIIDEVL